MPYQINGKFVSKEKYEAHLAAQEEKVTVSEETVEKKERNVSPLTAAQRRYSKARRRVETARAKAAKVQDVRDELDAAETEFAEATDQLQAVLDD